MRSIAFSSAGGGAILRAAKVCRSGSRSLSSSTSAPGLREMCPPSGRIWRCSSSDSLRVAARMMPRLVGEAQRGVAQRDQHLQPRHAVGDVEHGVAQIADLARQPAQIFAIEFAVGVAEHQRRLRQQRDDAARQHVGAAAERPLACPDSKSSRRPASGRWRGSARCRRRADAAASRSRAAPPPNLPTAARDRRSSGRGRSRSCRRTRSGRHRSRRRGWRRRCADRAGR